jgi:BA14K-like protein
MRFKVGISVAALIIGSSALFAVEASAQGRHQGPGGVSPAVHTGNSGVAGRAYAGRSFRHDRGGRGWIGPAAGFVAGAAATGAYYGGDNGYYDNGYVGNRYADYAYADYAYADYAPLYGDVVDCIAKNRSYDRSTATYLEHDGMRHYCP